MAMIRTRARGELEGAVMRILWSAGSPLSAKEVQEAFDEPAPAYATVMTSLDRLEKKGQVVRSGDSPRKVRFEAAQAAHEHTSETMISALNGADDRRAVLLHFAGNLEGEEVELLRQAIAAREPKPRDSKR